MKKIISVVVLGLVLFPFLKVGAVENQKPELWLTWRASNYAPSSFEGKNIPTVGSPMNFLISLINQGKIINLANRNIYWYADDEFIKGGVGLTHFTFQPFKTGNLAIRVKVFDVNGGGFIGKAALILVTSPQAIIEAPTPTGAFSALNFKIKAIPYFFNTSDEDNFLFSWKINNQPPTSFENPKNLTIDLPDSTPNNYQIKINLSIKNSKNNQESAIKNLNLIFEKK
ncbi:MAG: hypothetical protein WCX12_02915 [Candidatus Paceibacterota bacterium]|jgi:hypothetical protein